jgi:hypothetical protein
MTAMETTSGIGFRWLDREELWQLEPLIQSRGWTPLNENMSRVIAAFDGDNLIGFCAFQCIPHVEPLWVDIQHRGTGLAEVLVGQMVDFLYTVAAPAAYIIAENPASELLAQQHGMERVKHPVYYKRA